MRSNIPHHTSLRQNEKWQKLTRSGKRPNPRKACTVVWVGFVFCSPCISGTSETWIKAKFSWPTRNWNWRMASMNGADSMSPTVPPNYPRQVVSGREGWRKVNWPRLCIRRVLRLYHPLGSWRHVLSSLGWRYTGGGRSSTINFRGGTHSRQSRTCTVFPRYSPLRYVAYFLSAMVLIHLWKKKKKLASRSITSVYIFPVVILLSFESVTSRYLS